jgi:hypothetical protein
MEKEFIPYKQALELKELQFDEPCLSGYSKSTEKLEYYSRPLITKDSFTFDAPTFSQIFRWFRQEHDLDYSILPTSTSGHRLSTRTFNIVIYRYYMNMNVQAEMLRVDGEIAEYVKKEEAELACLMKLIEIVKTK